MQKYAVNILKYWLPLAVVATVLSAALYVVAQQYIRLSANDPQIQMAEDAAAQLATGKIPQTLVTPDSVDIESSLAPYLILFNESGQPLASTAVLDGQTPVPPDGVFGYTKEHGQDRFSWQPKSGVRSAAVLVHFSGDHSGFVLAGRSLREVEKRESQLELLVGLAWVGALAAGLAVSLAAAVVVVRVGGGGSD